MNGWLSKVIVWLLLAVSAVAQDGGGEAGAWTLERLEAERASASEAVDGVTDEARTRALQYWDRAIAAFSATEPLRASAAAFAAARDEAPARLAAQKQALESLQSAAPLGVSATSSVDAIEGALDAARARATAARQALADVEAEAARRTARRAELPTLLTAARAASSRVVTPDASETSALVVAARSAFDAVDIERAQAEAAALEAELASYEARSDLLSARLDVATREDKVARDLVKALDELLTTRRKDAAADAAEEARRARARAAGDHPVVQRLAGDVADLADERVEVSGEAARASDRLNATRAGLERLRSWRRDVDKKVALTGLTESIALLLRRHRDDLPSVATLEQLIAEDVTASADAQLRLYDVEERLRDLRVSTSERVDELMAEVNSSIDESLAFEVRLRVESQLDALTEGLDDLRGELDGLSTRLSDLDTDQRVLLREVIEYRDYIDENVLWVPNAEPLGWSSLVTGSRGVTEVASTSTLQAVADAARAVVDVEGWRAWALLVLALAGLLARARLRRHVIVSGQEMGSRRVPSFRPTALALSVAAVNALIGPGILYALGWLLLDASAAAPGVDALGKALQRIAILAYGLVFLRRVSLRGGLGDVHLRWPQPGRRWLRQHAWVVAVFALPLYRFGGALTGDSGAAVGRVMLIVSMVLLATSTYAVFRRSSPLMSPLFAHATRGTVAQFHSVWFPIAVLAPVAVALASYAGYAYAAEEFALRLFGTWSLIAIVFVVYGVMLRWVTIEQRRLRLEQARRKRDAMIASAQATKEAGDLTADVALDDVTVEEIDVAQVDMQTRRLLQLIVTVVLGVGLYAIWSSIFPALNRMEAFELWSVPVETVSEDGLNVLRDVAVVSLGDGLVALLLTALIVLAVRNLPGLLELLVLRRLPLEPGMGYAITTLLRYAIVIGGLMTVAPLLGLTWDRAQWLVAAVSVGLGFGLQEIFANFVSGLILLLERPIRIGDIVTVGTTEGVITKIRMRATTIRDWDRRELLVPNREFITGQLVNWTLTDPITRVVFPIGVAYGTDPRVVTDTLLEIARADPLVLGEPAPHVVFRSFGDSSLNFELRVFIGTRDVWPRLVHGMNIAITDAFERKDITIPFPQRDVHVRTYGRGGGDVLE